MLRTISFHATSADAVDDSLEEMRKRATKVTCPQGTHLYCLVGKINILFPIWWQHSLCLVVSCQSMNATLHQNQPELGILVL